MEKIKAVRVGRDFSRLSVEVRELADVQGLGPFPSLIRHERRHSDIHGHSAVEVLFILAPEQVVSRKVEPPLYAVAALASPAVRQECGSNTHGPLHCRNEVKAAPRSFGSGFTSTIEP